MAGSVAVVVVGGGVDRIRIVFSWVSYRNPTAHVCPSIQVVPSFFDSTLLHRGSYPMSALRVYWASGRSLMPLVAMGGC